MRPDRVAVSNAPVSRSGSGISVLESSGARGPPKMRCRPTTSIAARVATAVAARYQRGNDGSTRGASEASLPSSSIASSDSSVGYRAPEAWSGAPTAIAGGVRRSDPRSSASSNERLSGESRSCSSLSSSRVAARAA